ncbi:LLM class flavin-dependent oxidoreductase [Salsuginibacillus kocurii]|uniref:LLM class flavin-dependent oxidoreductase n=1 Tax=Salsuginibacillus kocurii TaxID=427078 RepID=UPI00035E4674|nr:LLM class flavin-dependent oxidoreductase [Salsuginibacillus kocurii]
MPSISILDQSPVLKGQTGAEALHDTVKFAKLADELGYKRFWVSEHHDTRSLAGSSPEVLLPYLAAATKQIRLGSGGVMLPHYSAYKVAEQFKVIEALTPSRIDLGVGRAPGGMPRATMALHEGKKREVHKYPEQVEDLLSYLNDSLDVNHPYYGLKATPQVDHSPDVWILGSSEGSAEIAAQHGLPFCYAQFINGEDGKRALERYQKSFQPSPMLKKPYAMLTLFAVCAETITKAEKMVKVTDEVLLAIEQGKQLEHMPTYEDVSAQTYTEYERKRIQYNRSRMVVGTGASIKEELESWNKGVEVDEWMFVTLTSTFEEKIIASRELAGALL